MADKQTPPKRSREAEAPDAPRKIKKVDVPDEVALAVMRKSLDAALYRCSKISGLIQDMTGKDELLKEIHLLIEKVEDSHEAMNNVSGPFYSIKEQYIPCHHPGGKSEAETCHVCGGAGGQRRVTKTNVWKYVNPPK